MDSDFWNERYIAEEYVYGKEPNFFFFRNFINQKLQTPGKLLLPAEGEGRNAIFAAGHGYQVTAFDFSPDGKKRHCGWQKKKRLVSNIYFQTFSLSTIFLHFTI